ncbi:MAG: UDP-N-acetylmuramoyl-L-alanyl-D-glutamate--2,6-diaminopimelate ligase [Calditrichaeota bacterium]|nr:MAG: UDP-N-acetylmuramoyl-L-alanyl-D-glutamate--2,6-diaminopimelate ligase [Calditrichota bacterium]
MKRVKDILEGVPVVQVQGDVEQLVRNLHYDSRRLEPGDGFVAVRGFTHDGHRFVEQAYQKGCRVFFVEDPVKLPDAVVVQLPDTRRWLPFLARNFFDRAVEQLRVVGITGTNGKTTTAFLLYAVLERAGFRPGLITTVLYRIGDREQAAERTTPEALDLHRMFYQMVRQGRKSVVMEVSSHALALHRTDGIPFAAAVFTNLGHDHLDFHGTLENYFAAKRRLFEELAETSRAVVNLDDARSAEICAATRADLWTYSLSDPQATVSLLERRLAVDGQFLRLRVPSGELHVTTGLVGRYNVANILAAVATALALGVTEERIVEGIAAVQNVPGRCERLVAPGGTRIFVDYAHTPDALQQVMEALLEYQPERLIVVFGCGGDRDREKRPLMGRVAGDFADLIWVTSDNPRSEDPAGIAEAIVQGIAQKDKVKVELDRRKAIAAALQAAGRRDFVLIAGKGHETYQEVRGRRLPFDDRQVVREILGLQKAPDEPSGRR